MDFKFKAQIIFALALVISVYLIFHAHNRNIRVSSVGLSVEPPKRFSQCESSPNHPFHYCSYACEATYGSFTPGKVPDNRTLETLTSDADKGDISAQLDLGVIYSKEDDFAQKWIVAKADEDDQKAADWFRRAADQGSPCGQGRLGQLYLEGKGIGKSDAEAYFWLALSTGDDLRSQVAFVELRKRAAAKLTAAQRGDVLDRVKMWKPHIIAVTTLSPQTAKPKIPPAVYP